MKEIFDHKRSGPTTRMGDKFARPNVNKVYKGENSLRNFGPVIWNTMLPQSLKLSSNLNEFKNSIKSWIPKNCPCRLCKHYLKDVGYIKVFE